MNSDSSNKINCYELPTNSNVNLAPFYEIGRLVRKANIKEKFKKDVGKNVYIDALLIRSLIGEHSHLSHYVQNFKVGPSFEEIKGRKNIHSLGISEDIINQAKKQIVNLVEIFKQNSFLTALIEISIYDPQDSKGNVFYTFLFANSVEILSKYTNEMVENAHALAQRIEKLEIGNISQETITSRGPIIPNPNLYRIPLFHLSKTESAKCEKLDIEKSTLIIGAYDVPVHDGFESIKSLKVHIEGFLDAVLTKCIESGNNLILEANSAILIPIARPAAQPSGDFDSFFQLHRHRGGGLFIFGEQGQDFDVHKFALSLKTELTQSIMDISYSQVEADKRAEKARSHVISTFTHEIKHLFGALQRNWVPELSRLLDIEIEDKGLPPNKKLGIIKLWDKKMEQTLSITPFRPFIETLNKLIFLWSGQYNPADIPFEERPSNLTEAIESSWKFAISVFVISVLYRHQVEDCSDVYKVEKLYENLIRVYPSLNIKHNQKNVFYLHWDKAYAKSSMACIHILMSMFLNMVKHCDPSREISIRLSKVKNSHRILITIENYKWAESDLSKIVNRLRSNSSSNKFDYDLHDIICTLERAKTHIEDIDVQKMHTREIIEKLLEQIDGKLISYHELPPEKFKVEFELGFQK